eukprot:1834005-Rhodomonas_salina.1
MDYEDLLCTFFRLYCLEPAPEPGGAPEDPERANRLRQPQASTLCRVCLRFRNPAFEGLNGQLCLSHSGAQCFRAQRVAQRSR